MSTTAASWEGSVRVNLYHRDGKDYARVSLAPWQGKGVSKLIYEGPVGEYAPRES